MHSPASCQPDGSPAPPRPTLELVATLFTQAQIRAALPAAPQIALVGRSNVGKSSLINALAQRRQLAKTSSTPGKTRSVNLFRVQPDGFYLTDLPGYGYAKRSQSERRAWEEIITSYLLSGTDLKAVLLLLDCRLPPQEADRRMVDFARGHGLKIFAVLTKADKCTQRERATRRNEWAVLLPRPPLPVSAQTGLGLAELWAELRAAAQG